MKKLIYGIDPGKTGGLVAIDENRKVIVHESMVYDEADEDRLNKGWLQHKLQEYVTRYSVYIYVEKQLPASFQGGVSVTLINYGIILGLAYISLVQLFEVNPNTWTKVILPPEFSKLSYSERKKQNALLAQTRFSDWHPKTTNEIKTQADAFLIAEYGWKNQCENIYGESILKEPLKAYLQNKELRKKRSKIDATDFFLGED